MSPQVGQRWIYYYYFDKERSISSGKFNIGTIFRQDKPNYEVVLIGKGCDWTKAGAKHSCYRTSSAYALLSGQEAPQEIKE